MNKEIHIDKIKDIAAHHPKMLLELPTSFGKTKIALELLKFWQSKKILVVVPRLVLIETWREECNKWGYDSDLTIVTYRSLHKYIGHWDAIVFDECHHLSDRCADILCSYSYDHVIGLSATIRNENYFRVHDAIKGIYTYKVTTRQAIDEKILPDPFILLFPLYLDNDYSNQTIIINPKAKMTMMDTYKNRWKYLKNKNIKGIISCTALQYNSYITERIDFLKRRYIFTKQPYLKNRWLSLAGERLKWLSSLKENYVLFLLRKLHNYRCLTFCSSIEQTEKLGEYCINSSNPLSSEYLRAFNEGGINHITACDMLNEGVNLTNCQIGIYASLNSSEVVIKQKLGRLLRHRNPIILIPYFLNTRDEEIVKKMIKDYNPHLIKKVSAKDFMNYVNIKRI
jgi:superfamily II DNA or RNA helicase